MTDTAYLTEKQIDGIMNVLEKDHIDPAINNKYKEIEASEEFIKLTTEYKDSDEFKKLLQNEEDSYKRDVEINKLYKKIIKLGGEISRDEWGDIPELADTDEETLTKVFNNTIEKLNNTTDTILNKMKICRYKYNICSDIKEDIIARLRLTQVGNFDEIIESMKKYIDVDKYIHIS